MRRIHKETDLEQVIQLRGTLITDLTNLFIEIVDEKDEIVKMMALYEDLDLPDYLTDDVQYVDDTSVIIRLHRAETALFNYGRYFVRTILVRPDGNFTDAKKLSGTSMPLLDVVPYKERTSEGDKQIIYTSVGSDLPVIHNNLMDRDLYPSHEVGSIRIDPAELLSFPQANLGQWMGFTENFLTSIQGAITSNAEYVYRTWNSGAVPLTGQVTFNDLSNPTKMLSSYKDVGGTDYRYLVSKLIKGTIIEVFSTDVKKTYTVELTTNCIAHNVDEYFENNIRLLSRPANSKDLANGDAVYFRIYPSPFQASPPQYDILVDDGDVALDGENLTAKYGELTITQDSLFNVINRQNNGFYAVVFINNTGGARTLTVPNWWFRTATSGVFTQVSTISVPVGRSVLQMEDYNGIMHARW